MEAIDAQKDEHDDVNFLSTYPPLLAAIDDAMNGVLGDPGLGLGRWKLEQAFEMCRRCPAYFRNLSFIVMDGYFRKT
jgi:hypothetical protein